MIQTLIKNWWLLALCSVLTAMYSVMNLLMRPPDGSLMLRTFGPEGTLRYMGMVALAAGACAIAAGIWSSRKGKSWLLVLNGLAFIAYGLIPVVFSRVPLPFRLFALLLILMAMSMGIFELATARTLRRHVADEWFLRLAGAASVGFALAFLALAFRWIQAEQPGSIFLWLGSYFGFSAICMLGLALHLHGLRAAIHHMASSALPTG